MGQCCSSTLSDETTVNAEWLVSICTPSANERERVNRVSASRQPDCKNKSNTDKWRNKEQYMPNAERKQISNSGSIIEFFLLAFMDTWQLQLLHFWLFLGIYLAALLGNGLIITAVACDHRLHTPMYFFLLNLSLLDLGSISTTVPQIHAEYCILTIMAYDRYVAICKPLHYGTLLGSRACTNKTAAAWGSGFLHAVLHTANTFSLPLCQGNVVDQFFCEILKLSCADSYLRKVGLIVVSLLAAFGWFVFIVLSYVQIFMAVLRIPSEQGQHKAFSMCLPHLAVVSLFISTGMFNYLKPLSISSVYAGLAVAVLSTKKQAIPVLLLVVMMVAGVDGKDLDDNVVAKMMDINIL
ncbi:olfactory receptor 14C36-like [Haliaeetus albicilla]|uniref:olfactory receptor 14C36-like n=1 Tax=Haliaeetus albicilla TaxID=8969 RepID=UPI0037E82074